jgi:hypothetical protein
MPSTNVFSISRMFGEIQRKLRVEGNRRKVEDFGRKGLAFLGIQSGSRNNRGQTTFCSDYSSGQMKRYVGRGFYSNKSTRYKKHSGSSQMTGTIAYGIANQTLHQTPVTWAVAAGAGGGAGELNVGQTR